MKLIARGRRVFGGDGIYARVLLIWYMRSNRAGSNCDTGRQETSTEGTRLMKLHHLRNVVAIVERGSLRAAAKHLGLAQPAMSRSIKELELELGVILFQRHKFGMTLTPLGAIFVRRAKGMLVEFQRTLDEIEQIKGTDFGIITVAFSAVGHLALLPKMLGPFRRRFPNMRMKVVEGTFPVLETDIRDGIIDLYYGAVSKGVADPALVVDPLFENERIVVARHGHPLSQATTLQELVGASWVAAPVAIDNDSEVNSLFEGSGLPAPHIAMQASTSLSMLSIIMASDLLAPLPQQWVDFIGSTHLIERIPLKEVLAAPRICGVRRANIPLTPAAEYLNDLALRAAAVHLRERRPL